MSASAPSGEAPRGDLLVATFSGRSIAASARAAGFRPLVADLFADNDLRDVAADHRIVRGNFVDGFDAGDLMAALESLGEDSVPVGVVCGPGFEDRPELLEAIAARWRLLGNSGATVRALKDPEGFADLCRRCAVRHPETRRQAPDGAVPAEWLSKRGGAAGGLHIGFLGARAPAPDRYVQRFVPGARRSALFVAGGGRAVVLAFSEQWPSPSASEPFRYGGACGPVRLDAAAEAEARRAVDAIAAAIPALVGLGSADFILPDGGGAPVLLEINPRPGATIDVFEREELTLMAVHLAACDGHLPDTPPAFAAWQFARAAGFAYLDVEELEIPAFDWPDDVSDRPVPGTRLRRGDPIFTLKADGADADAAIARFHARLAHLKTAIEEPET